MALLTNQTKKNHTFTWDERCGHAFTSMKKKLMSAPMLVYLEGNIEMTVYTDEYGMGMGEFLMHDRRVIAYASRQLKPYEWIYPIHDLELVAIVFF